MPKQLVDGRLVDVADPPKWAIATYFHKGAYQKVSVPFVGRGMGAARRAVARALPRGVKIDDVTIEQATGPSRR